jgi:penicillin V acylase-like amidase (Ntn superfamily)
MNQMKKFCVIAILMCLFFVLPNTIFACTTFCLDTPNGPIFGCNLDLFIPGDGLVFINRRDIAKKGFEPGTTGKVAEWTSKYGSVTFNLAGREWAFGGMNEAGLVLGAMELITSKFPSEDERPPLPIGPWSQYVLDMCSNVEEVIAVNDKIRIKDSAPPVHFLIANANGNCVAIEWHDGKLVYRKGNTLPVKAMANTFYDEALAVYKRGGPRWWQSDRGDSNKRFSKAAIRNKEFKDSGESNAIKYAFETLTHVVAAPHTKWNIVYDISRRQVYFRSIASPTVKYLSLNKFNLSCSAPLLMLDINAPLKGNIEESFKPYNHEANLAVFQTLCARYGIELSTEDAINIMKHIESFGCAP